jgi:hypothetical protein
MKAVGCSPLHVQDVMGESAICYLHPESVCSLLSTFMILIVKGTVQQKLTGVESDIERWCSIFTFKGNSLFKLQKNRFQWLESNSVAAPFK